MTRKVPIAVAWVACGLALASPAQDAPPAYRSPYRVEFRFPRGDLIADLDLSERGDPKAEAAVPHPEWYGRRTRERWGAWGPRARSYPPAEVEGWPVERLRERVIAAALRFRGYEYQHHHVPDWDPPRDWPWLKVGAGRNGKGVDCSNFTGFVYNQGFGIGLSTDVGKQAEQRIAQGPGRAGKTPLHRVDLPEAFDERVAALRTGDLLFIRNRSGEVSHVVLWVGPIGRSPDGTPLVLDSHGADTRDSNGTPIPAGVQLRPYRETSWYHRSASHALRVFPDR